MAKKKAQTAQPQAAPNELRAQREVQDLFEQYTKKGAEIRKLKDKLKDLETESDLLKAALVRAIKPNTEKAGVYHQQYTVAKPKYKEILQQVRDRFVPKTKQTEVDVIVQENTTESVVDVIKAAALES